MKRLSAAVAAIIVVATALPASAQGWTNACWEEAQQKVAAEIEPQVNAAEGICQNAQASQRMYELLLGEARQCDMPQQGIDELQSLINQSAATAQASCV